MKMFYKEEPEKIEKSKQRRERLKKVDPKPDEKELQKVEMEIITKFSEREKALQLRNFDLAYRLGFEIESLQGKQADIKLKPWKEIDSLRRELTELNSASVENSSMWLMKEIKDLDFMLQIEVLEKLHNPVTMTYRYRILNNFAKVREIQGKLLEAKNKIQGLLSVGSIAEIEKIYLDALELIPSKIPCTEELEVDEATYQEMQENIRSGADKPSQWLTMTSMRYIP